MAAMALLTPATNISHSFADLQVVLTGALWQITVSVRMPLRERIQKLSAKTRNFLALTVPEVVVHVRVQPENPPGGIDANFEKK